MTSEEIKQQYTMNDILSRYGLQANRGGFIPCPFHKEKTGSMKVYKDSYHCFGCGANGDVFTFVQEYEGLTFKEAYQSLGGAYERPTFSSNLAIYRAGKRRRQMILKQHQEEQKKQRNNLLIGAYRRGVELNEPLSDAWCENYNALQYQLYIHGLLNDIDLRW